MFRSSKIWKILWISGIYLILGIILYLVILYKVKWEYKDLNTYLYFYDCGHNLCSSDNNVSNYYSKVLCEDDICPYIQHINGNMLVLHNNNKSFIYNYIKGNVVNDKYNEYRYIGNDMYVVNDENFNYGIINSEGEILLDLKYKLIDEYTNGIISYIDNNLYGIVSVDGKYDIEPNYEDIVLINDKIFAGKKDNIYQIYSYNNEISDNSNKYNFIYVYNDVIITFKDKKIDILNPNLNSILVMKIDSFYEYITEKEKGSLDIYCDGEYIYFDVFINENEFTSYKFDIKNKKLI